MKHCTLSYCCLDYAHTSDGQKYCKTVSFGTNVDKGILKVFQHLNITKVRLTFSEEIEEAENADRSNL
jgi:hypothetical protein